MTSVILAVLLTLSLFSHLSGFSQRMHLPLSRATASEKSTLEEVTFEDNGSAHEIAVIDISGIISGDSTDGGGNLVEHIQDQLDRAADSHSVKAVVLRIDSPGGEVLASDEIAKAITDFQEDSKKPVVACMGSLAASGGYYISAPCRWIVAHELTITGSIGVIMHGYNYRGLLAKVGVRPEVFKSGKFKDMLSGEKSDEEILPEERQMVQSMIQETYNRFKEVVRTGRTEAHKKNLAAKDAQDHGRPLADNWTELADGRILSGRQAEESGFVDELGNFDVAVERAQKLAGISNSNLIRYQRPLDFSHLLRFLGQSESRSLKVQLGPEFPKVQKGRLYFLAPLCLP